jgi:hypothetical protein
VFTFNPGLVHQYNTTNEQFGNPFQLNFSRLLPDMFARWDLKKSENLTYNFNVRNGFNDVNALVEGYVLRILIALRVEIHNWKTHCNQS